jgi:5-methylcytosine-specific restriction endonuclease McrA
MTIFDAYGRFIEEPTIDWMARWIDVKALKRRIQGQKDDAARQARRSQQNQVRQYPAILFWPWDAYGRPVEDATLDWMSRWGDARALRQRAGNRRFYDRHREQVRKEARERARLPEEREKYRIRRTRYYRTRADVREKNRQYHQSAKYKEWERKYHEENKEARAKRAKAWILAHPDRMRELDQRRRDKDRKAYNKRIREQRARVIEQTRANRRKFYRAHREEIAVAQALVRAYRKRAEGRFTTEDIQQKYYEQREICIYCRVSIKESFEVDHKTPLARGGSNWPENIQLTCMPCNRRKQARTDEEHRAILAEEEAA